MTYMEQIAKMLDVEINEEFKIEGYADNLKFQFTENRFLQSYGDAYGWVDSISIMNVLEGRAKIIKLPKQILTDEEKAYLSAVIKPFKNRVRHITKYDLRHEGKYEFICIDLIDYGNVISIINLPYFVKDALYTGMKLDKAYDLKELEL